MECEHCKIFLKSKYSLKNHLVNNKSCLKIRGLTLDTEFICRGCNVVFMNNNNLTVHTDTCKKYIKVYLQDGHKKEIQRLEKEHSEQIEKIIKTHKDEMKEIEFETHIRYNELQTRYNDLSEQYDKTVSKLELKINQCDTFIQSLAREGVNKPTTTTTNTVNNNIRNILSQEYTLDKLESKQIEDTIREHYTERDFYNGQKGLADFCVKRLIKTPDGKMLLCCTDSSRKKFKILDMNGNMKEDIEAREFCRTLEIPIKTITKEIYDRIEAEISKEKARLSKDDFSRREKLNGDSMRAQQVFVKNMNFDDLNYNQEFIHELCVLLS